jgi:thioredoxin-related protein
MKYVTKIFLLCIVLAFYGSAQTAKPDSAQVILHRAEQHAAATHRHVLVIFHASWCKWCKKLDTALTDKAVSAIIEKQYVVVHLDVLERKEAIALYENPGGADLLNEFGGGKAGIPFFVILDTAGKNLGNSNILPDHQNVGYPSSKEEIAAFTEYLKRHAPAMTKHEQGKLAQYFLQHAPKE